jgi:beta-glucosidase
MPKDVQLIKRLGLKAYRFSTAWPRVLPIGHGKVNEAGLDFYDRLVDNLLDAEIEPFLTLYHWDLPEALSVKGGWLNRDTGAYFADYAALMVRRLGDRVRRWTTFNEPEVIVAGYIGTGLAPGANDQTLGAQVGHNLLVAHGQALQAIRAIDPALEAGIVLNLVPVEPLTPAAAPAAQRRWDINYGWYLDALFKASYPDVVLDGKGNGPIAVKPGDMALIAQRMDFLGINYYLRLVVNEQGETCPVPGAKKTQMDWEIYPRALGDMLVDLSQKYRLPPIYITENGAALDDTVVAGRIHDADRIKYLHEHLQAIESAIAGGADVRGYFIWSLMDNLEWSLGFAKTFGIVHVHRKTLKRTIKDSGFWYRDVIRANTARTRTRTRRS